jgi:hypothetical protein
MRPTPEVYSQDFSNFNEIKLLADTCLHIHGLRFEVGPLDRQVKTSGSGPQIISFATYMVYPLSIYGG